MNIVKYIALAFVYMLTSCTTTQHVRLEAQIKKQESPVLAEKKELSSQTPTALSSWEISGAIAAKSHKKGWTASLNWLQNGMNEYQIRLFGPLGGKTVMIEKHGGLVTYQDGPKHITATKADLLLQKETGIQLPVSNLYYWVRGIAAPGAIQSAEYDPAHCLLALHQAGYTINYMSYVAVNGMHLPSKISLQGHGVVIKLVIKHWKLGSRKVKG